MLGPFSFYTAIPEEQLMDLTGREPFSLAATTLPAPAQGRALLEYPFEHEPPDEGEGRRLAPQTEMQRRLDRDPLPRLHAPLRFLSGRYLKSSAGEHTHAKKRRPPPPPPTDAARALWAKVEPFTMQELHHARSIFLKVAHAAKAETCRKGLAGAPPHGRLYHRVFEPGAKRDKYADCPMICAPDWRGFLEMEMARKTGCVFNCLANPVNFSDPNGNNGGGVKSEMHGHHHKKKASKPAAS